MVDKSYEKEKWLWKRWNFFVLFSAAKSKHCPTINEFEVTEEKDM